MLEAWVLYITEWIYVKHSNHKQFFRQEVWYSGEILIDDSGKEKITEGQNISRNGIQTKYYITTKILEKLIHFTKNWGHICIVGFMYYSF